jgi:hypothetical protein
MFVTYLAALDTNRHWHHAKYPGDKDGPVHTSVQMEDWIEVQAIEALRDNRRVWVYCPYSLENQGDEITGAISILQTKLVAKSCTDNTDFGKNFRSSIRQLRIPMRRRLQNVSGARCVVYYVEPCKE